VFPLCADLKFHEARDAEKGTRVVTFNLGKVLGFLEETYNGSLKVIRGHAGCQIKIMFIIFASLLSNLIISNATML
jgi:hypothetical protein